MHNISPAYQMKIIEDIENEIWERYKSYKKVEFYIKKWHVYEENGYDYWENFTITLNNGNIDLRETLHSIDGDTILKIAIDLGIKTPDFIPSIPQFRNEIKANYPTASQTFEKAFREIEEHPDISIGLVNSALESIIKELLMDERVKINHKDGDTLTKLVRKFLKEVSIFPNSDLPTEIRNISSSLLSAAQSIEQLRSSKTNFHGKTNEDYYINEPLYTYFVVNSVTTVGLLLISLYQKYFPQLAPSETQDVDDIDDLPF